MTGIVKESPQTVDMGGGSETLTQEELDRMMNPENIDTDEDSTDEEDDSEDSTEQDGDDEDGNTDDEDAGEADEELGDSDEEDGTDDEDDEEDSDSPQIPKGRFDEAVGKERDAREAAEDRAAFLEEQLAKLIDLQERALPKEPIAPKVDVAALEEQYLEKALAGETSEALAIRKQINAENQRVLDAVIKSVKEEARVEATTLSENDKFNLVVADAVNKFPQLDKGSDEFDQELTSSVNALSAGLQSTQKLSPSKAMEKAVKQLVKAKKAPVKKTSKRRSEKKGKVDRTPQKAPSSRMQDVDASDIDWANMTEAQFDRMKTKHPNLINKQLGLV